MKRAVVLFGAGASIEYGAPSTSKLTATVQQQVEADDWLKNIGGDKIYAKIKAGLEGYLRHPGLISFEHIYHCVHELIYVSEPPDWTLDEFRPLLYPFLGRKIDAGENILLSLARKIVQVILVEVSMCCENSKFKLDPLAKFIGQLRHDHVTRIYTTNYDDFPLQAMPNLYTGFCRVGDSPWPFDLEAFWTNEDEASLFHLHGAVHLGFPRPIPPGGDIGELFWFEDRAEALRYSDFSGTDSPRMDGTGVLRTSIITGLDKLSRLQQRPLSHFYAALARDLMRCDVIYVIGSGLGDLHLNTWLHEARTRNPRTPVLFIDLWDGGFPEHVMLEHDRKMAEMFRSLNIRIRERNRGLKSVPGWTVSEDRSAAIWDRGFQAFLAAPEGLQEVLGHLRFR